jgi:hypothetical protein
VNDQCQTLTNDTQSTTNNSEYVSIVDEQCAQLVIEIESTNSSKDFFEFRTCQISAANKNDIEHVLMIEDLSVESIVDDDHIELPMVTTIDEPSNVNDLV